MRKVVDLIEKLNDNEVALYLDECGLMHATNRKENAERYAVGKIMITDECEAKGGMPVIDGIRVEIWGAGDGWVYLSNYTKSVNSVYKVKEGTLHIDNTMTIHHKDLPSATHAAYRKANEFYMAILDDKDE